MAKVKNKILRNVIGELISFSFIAVGCVMAAAALEIFLIPNSIIDGGLTGVSIILSKVTALPLSMFIICLNIPFLLIGYDQMGKRFLVKAGFAMILFAYLLSLFEGMTDVTDDIILATIYGGLLLGIGVGLVIKFGACLDGTEIVAILVSKRNSLSVGQVVLFFNIFIYGSAIFVFGPDRALYSLLTYFITFKLIDMVSEGMDQAKAVTIITDKSEDISEAILKRLGRNVTIMNGNGMMSHPDKIILYVVITRLELPELRSIIKEADVNSFVTVTDISEMIGNHIKKIPKK
ncbi:MAG: YitT family protein [Bacilli bacterium]|nr:YitT family protein [Bacilli bacterium]